MKNIKETLNFKPVRLLPSEVENPHESFDRFFEDFELHEIREDIYQLYRSWVNDNEEAANGKYHCHMIMVYESLIDLVDSAYILTNGIKKQNH